MQKPKIGNHISIYFGGGKFEDSFNKMKAFGKQCIPRNSLADFLILHVITSPSAPHTIQYSGPLAPLLAPRTFPPDEV